MYPLGQSAAVRPKDVQQIGTQLAILWEDGGESIIPLETLRRECPCAACKGEMDVMGNLYKGPAAALGPRSFQLQGLSQVGTYAIQPAWGDGHNSGIYSFEYLRRLAEAM